MHLHFLSRKWQRNKLKLSHVGFLYIVLFYSHKVWIHLHTCYPWLEHFGNLEGGQVCIRGSFTVIAVFAGCPDANIIATDPMVNFTIPHATDGNTGKPLTVSCSPMPGTNFTKNSTVVNCMASDADGHVAPQMCSFNVQICKKITPKKKENLQNQQLYLNWSLFCYQTS